jgi:serine/threonine protein kinase
VWTDRLVAGKVPTDPAYLRELQREGVTTPQIAHPNVVRAVGFDPFADPPYLAMEFVPGTSLRPLIAGRRLSIDDAVVILRQVLAGLAHAHAQGVVHRDVKPENILIREGATDFAAPGAVMLSDFGLGQSSRAFSPDSIAMSMSVRTPGAAELVGTLDYMPPEQRAGGAVDGRADLYACGVVLFEMLTGERPAGNELPSELNPAVPAWLDAIFRKAYARRDVRFASAEAFAEALNTHATPAAPSLPIARRVGPPPLPVGPDRCAACRGHLDKDDQFCTSCGVQAVDRPRRCPACDAYPAMEDRYCILCGTELGVAVVPD